MIRLRRNSEGGVAIEYALLGAIIGLGIVAALVGTKRSLNVEYDTLSYAMGQATKPDATAKTIVSTVNNPDVSYSGQPVKSKTVTYSDGSRDVLLDATNSSVWFKTYAEHYDANGVNTGADWINGSGSPVSSRTTVLGPTTAIYAQTGDGSCNCTYRSAWSYVAQPDGSNMIVYNNDIIDGTNAPSWMYKSQVVVYNATPTTYDYVGDVSTSATGVVTKGGQDISKYMP